MNYQEDKIARKEYDTVKVGKPNYTYDDFLKEYYPADYKAQKQAKSKTPKLQFTVRPTPTLTPAQPKKPAVKIETPKTRPIQTMSAEERIAEGLAGKPIHIELKKDHRQLKSEQERKSQEVRNKNYQQKEDAYHAQVQKTQEENRQKEIKEQQQRVKNAQNAAISMYPSDPEMQKWGQNYLIEQGFDQSVEKVNLNNIKKQIDNAYELHTTGKRQEAKHAEVAEEHQRRTDEAAEQKRKAEEEAAQKKEEEAQRKATLNQKYDEKAPSVRMAERLFPDDPTYAEEFAEELQRQHYDDYIRNNYIDIDDSTQWDEKSVRTMSDHLHRFFVKKDYKDFEAKQLADQLAGKAITFSGVPVIHDREYIEGSEHGEVERTAKQNHNAYAAEKLANSATTWGEAYKNYFTENMYRIERDVDKLRDQYFPDATGDLFHSNQVDAQEDVRRERAAYENPDAVLTAIATEFIIQLLYGGLLEGNNVLTKSAGASSATLGKTGYSLSELMKGALVNTAKSIPMNVIDGIYEDQSFGELAKNIVDDTVWSILKEAFPQVGNDILLEGFRDGMQEYKKHQRKARAKVIWILCYIRILCRQKKLLDSNSPIFQKTIFCISPAVCVTKWKS